MTTANHLPRPSPQPKRRRNYIVDLEPGQRLDDELFMIQQKDLRTTNNGGLYIHVVFRDRTGQLLARIWSATEPMYQQLTEGGFARVRGRVENYKGAIQFIVEGFRPVQPGDVDLTDFLPKTPFDQDTLVSRLHELLELVRHPDCRAISQEFTSDAEFMARLRDAPAAMNLHHAYIGGLLEHTVNLMELAAVVCPRYPSVSQDLVLTGAFLHDVGKTFELKWDTAFSYSDGGQLVGHVVKGAVWVEQRARDAGRKRGKPISEEIIEVLQHIILSHHGQPEFGAARLPATPEAILIHLLDNIDAKLHFFIREIASDRDHMSSWTGFHKSIETKIYKLDPTASSSQSA